MPFSAVFGLSLLPMPSSVWFLLVGAAGLVAFVLWESKVESPVLNINLFRKNRAVDGTTFDAGRALGNPGRLHYVRIWASDPRPETCPRFFLTGHQGPTLMAATPS